MKHKQPIFLQRCGSWFYVVHFALGEGLCGMVKTDGHVVWAAVGCHWEKSFITHEQLTCHASDLTCFPLFTDSVTDH
jgi:hypothetical protein